MSYEDCVDFIEEEGFERRFENYIDFEDFLDPENEDYWDRE